MLGISHGNLEEVPLGCMLVFNIPTIEIDAVGRPKNSLLEEDLDFEHLTRTGRTAQGSAVVLTVAQLQR